MKLKPFIKFEFYFLGSNVTLPCQADGFPEPQISWFRGSAEIARDESSSDEPSRSVQLAESDDLLLTVINLEDEGLYTCRAFNNFGTVSATAQLTVTGTGNF